MSEEQAPETKIDQLRQRLSSRPGGWRDAGSRVDASALERELRRAIAGEVRFDAGSKAMYAVDASNYRQVPIGVVIPKSIEDVVRTVELCRQFGAPILSRGGGTSLSGQCCNVAIVIDWSKYMNRILELNIQERYARVEPGVICDAVVNAARPHKLTYAPDPATHAYCCFGGMLGNNSCGVHAQMNGPAVDNVEEMDVLLYDGTRMQAGWLTDSEWDRLSRQHGRTGEIYAGLRALRRRYEPLIRERFANIPRRISGYNLDRLIPDPSGRINLARVLVGTEGTCATMLEAKVGLVYMPPERVLLMLGYEDVYRAADHVPEILPYLPIGLEGLDQKMMRNVEKKGGIQATYLPLLPAGGGWLMVELGRETQAEAEEAARAIMLELEKQPDPPATRLFVDKREQQKIWKLRESGVGLSTFVPGEKDAWSGWEDSAVPPGKVGPYLRDLRRLLDKYGYHTAFYGHFGQGCIHCRMDFNLVTADGIRHWRRFMEEASDLVVSYGGSLSGEHGDGQGRAEFLYKQFGEELVEAFREFKSIWDPDWKMNPGKVVDASKIDENLRLGAGYAPWEPRTHFQYPDDEGKFSRAVLRCVGVGKCRRLSASGDEDTMCPSFMVIREERNTTRGRAHQLWEMVNGGAIESGWRSEEVKEALELCLSCKGCKSDCPVNVDMATYKAEFLAHYWQGRLRPRQAYAFGLVDQWARFASSAPGLVNLFTQLPGLSAIAKTAAGIPAPRHIPALAPQTFQDWFRRRAPRHSARKVVLWPDTFNNYFFPQTARAAVEVLESAGYQVEVPREHVCCGRPLYDYGFLERAKSYLEHDLRVLAPHLEVGTPMVVLEPSCCSVFRDELRNLFPRRDDARRLRETAFTLSEFLQKKAGDFAPPRLERQALVQGHCHHKAIMRMTDEEEVMQRMGLDYQLLDSGCCGMAGAFGYEAATYQVAQDCGERVLLPKVREAASSTLILADGFSCRQQVAQSSGRQALHLAEVLQLALRHGPRGPQCERPEDEVFAPHRRSVKRSMAVAGTAAGVVAAGALVLGLLAKRR